MAQATQETHQKILVATDQTKERITPVFHDQDFLSDLALRLLRQANPLDRQEPALEADPEIKSLFAAETEKLQIVTLDGEKIWLTLSPRLEQEVRKIDNEIRRTERAVQSLQLRLADALALEEVMGTKGKVAPLQLKLNMAGDELLALQERRRKAASLGDKLHILQQRHQIKATQNALVEAIERQKDLQVKYNEAKATFEQIEKPYLGATDTVTELRSRRSSLQYDLEKFQAAHPNAAALADAEEEEPTK